MKFCLDLSKKKYQQMLKKFNMEKWEKCFI